MVRQYTAGHPMLVAKTGDPARGEWAPKDKKNKPKKKGR